MTDVPPIRSRGRIAGTLAVTLAVAATLAACGPAADAPDADRRVAPADTAPADTAPADTARLDTAGRDGGDTLVVRTPATDPWLFEGIPNFEDLVAMRDGDWMVVLASAERAGARPRPTIMPAADSGLAAVQRRAWNARHVPFVIASEELPAFAPGRTALVLGPFARAAAEARLADVRAYAPDAYLKAGW